MTRRRVMLVLAVASATFDVIAMRILTRSATTPVDVSVLKPVGVRAHQAQDGDSATT